MHVSIENKLLPRYRRNKSGMFFTDHGVRSKKRARRTAHTSTTLSASAVDDGSDDSTLLIDVSDDVAVSDRCSPAVGNMSSSSQNRTNDCDSRFSAVNKTDSTSHRLPEWRHANLT